jgi:hypothetical protein
MIQHILSVELKPLEVGFGILLVQRQSRLIGLYAAKHRLVIEVRRVGPEGSGQRA